MGGAHAFVPWDHERVAPSVLSDDFVDDLRDVGLRAGLDAIGVATADPFDSTRADLESRRDRGLADTMQFTYRNPGRSTDPTRVLPGARSIVVAARSYLPPNESMVQGTRAGETRRAEPVARVARYARRDEYADLRRGLDQLANHVRHHGYKAVVVADENSLVDREAARRAGLGWYGKSSNVLLPGHGSWFVLGSVITDAPLPATTTTVEDGCGTCVRCIEGCPTGAIVEPGVVDAGRCLAWLVQREGVFPREYRESLGDRLYGCDDCQEVCPPNRAEARRAVSGPSADDESDLALVSVLGLLAADDETLLSEYGRWYIPRREVRYLRRNALVILGNIGDGAEPAHERALRTYLSDPDELLRAHAVWAAAQLGRRDLLTSVAADTSTLVHDELHEIGITVA